MTSDNSDIKGEEDISDCKFCMGMYPRQFREIRGDNELSSFQRIFNQSIILGDNYNENVNYLARNQMN
jgi:hypothetical protein